MEGCICLRYRIHNSPVLARVLSYFVFGSLFILLCQAFGVNSNSVQGNKIIELETPPEKLIPPSEDIKGFNEALSRHVRAATEAAGRLKNNVPWRGGVVCSSITGNMQFGNKVENLRLLERCTAIEGNLVIKFLTNQVTPGNYSGLVFPKLVEVTGYILFYRVKGLRSVGQLFPNLRVIRAEEQIYKYGLALYENEDMISINTPKLSYVGAEVLAMVNPQLCYVDDFVSWAKIIKGGQPPMTFLNRAKENGCDLVDGCSKKCTNNNCWERDHCQIVCNCVKNAGTDQEYNPGCDEYGRCCHDSCLGGCEAPGDPKKCYVCKNIYHNGECVDSCPKFTEENETLLEFAGRRCVTRYQCLEENPDNKFHEGRCISECPPTWEDPKFLSTAEHKLFKRKKLGRIHDDYENHLCQKCQGACQKPCHGGPIQTTNQAKKFKNCNIVTGNLEIALGALPGNITELEECLSDIQEVYGHVRIVRNSHLKSLSFLKNLRRIHGLERQTSLPMPFSLYVTDNDNLEVLWEVDPAKPLFLDNGKMFFQQNRVLCYKTIEKMLNNTEFNGTELVQDKLVNISKSTHHKYDISKTNNGQNGDCFNNSLYLEIVYRPTDIFFPLSFIFSAFKADERLILNYVLYYKILKPDEVPTYYRIGSDCDENKDSWEAIEVLKENIELAVLGNGERFYRDSLYDLKPYTRYAFYVQTYTTYVNTQDGTRSKIVIYTTRPGKPDKPMDVTVSALPVENGENVALNVNWNPPVIPNGKIDHYNVYYRKKPWLTDLIYRKDFCQDSTYSNKPQSEKDQPEQLITETTTNATLECTCKRKATSKEIRNKKKYLHYNFENFIQNDQFHKNPNYDLTMNNEYGFSDAINPALDNTRPIVDKTQSFNVTSNNSSKGFISDLNETKSETPTPRYDPLNEIASMVSVPANKTSVPIFNLEPKTEYSIEVIACHAYDNKERSTRCSERAIANAITSADPALDVINSTSFRIEKYQKNGDLHFNFTWESANLTNGPVLSYTIEYWIVRQDQNVVKANRSDSNSTRSTSVDRKLEEDGESANNALRLCVPAIEFMQNNNSYQWNVNHLHKGSDYMFRVRMRTAGTKVGEYTDPIIVTIAAQISDADPTSDKPEELVIVAIVVVIAVLAVVSILSIVCYKIKKRRPIPLHTLVSSENPEYSEMETSYVPDEWELERIKVKIGRALGQGSFGMVYEGEAKDLHNTDKKNRKVAIKTVNKDASMQDRINFLNEASRMKTFKCHHIVQLLGVVSQGQPVLVIMELMSQGDLKNYLRMHRPDEPDNAGRRPPTLREILQMASEIADGMAYLANEKFVHRDLAARNCMVAHDMTVKIGDFGLTRDIYDADYYRKVGKGMLPVRWMAQESLRDGVYTSKSDVWSFGVVLWEMATLAAQPYQGFSNDEVMKFVIDGRQMEMPDGCPAKLYEMMSDCWEYWPSQRPTFINLLHKLQGDVKKNFFSVSWYYSKGEDDSSHSEVDSIHLNEDNSECQPLHPASLGSSRNIDHADHYQLEIDPDHHRHLMDSHIHLGGHEADDEEELSHTPVKELIDLPSTPPPIPARLSSYRSLPSDIGSRSEEFELMENPLHNSHHRPLTGSSNCSSDSLNTGESYPPMCNGTNDLNKDVVLNTNRSPPTYNTANLDQHISTDPSIWSAETNSKTNSCNGSANGHMHFGNNALTPAC